MNGFNFGKQICLKCGKEYDVVRAQCPHCHALNQNDGVVRSWKECTPLGTSKEILAFLLGYLGLQIMTVFVQIVLALLLRSNILSSGIIITGDFSKTVFSVNDLSGGRGLSFIFLPSYLLLFLFFVFFLWGDIKPVLYRFKKPISYLGGFLAIVLIFLFNFLYGQFSAKFTGGQSNQNQSNIVSIVQLYPFTSLIVFGLLGPFCEECTYRLGLMNLLKRVNTIFAYICSALFFAAIHFDWGNVSSALEWINIPPYFFSGLVFAIIYDKFGFAASFLGHALNNIISVLMI